MTRVMTIFVFYVDPHFPNIGYFDVYGGIWGYTPLPKPGREATVCSRFVSNTSDFVPAEYYGYSLGSLGITRDH